MELDFLRKIGLSEGEIKIYNALLELGRSPINKIHESVGIERRNIYDILNKLIERGLISYVTENKKRFFQISHPKNIMGYIGEKESNLARIKNEVKKEMPLLLKKFSFERSEINAEIYRGAEGIKALWEDSLNYNDMYWIGAGRYIPKMFPLWFSNWNRKRIEIKNKWVNLLRYEIKKEIKKPMRYEKVKFLPREFSGNPTVIGLYGNKTINFLFGKELFAFVIESKELAENYRIYHKYLWDNVAIK